MTRLSARDGLKHIGEPRPGKGIKPIPLGLASVPPPGNDLEQIVKAMMLDPQPEAWVEVNSNHIDEHWTEECQGVTHGGGHFYFSCDDAGKPGSHDRAIYRYVGGGEVETVLEIGNIYGKHLGDLDFFDGKLFCAIEEPIGILVVDASTGMALECTPLKSSDGGSSPQTSCSWCAVNPWNRLLYSSEFRGPVKLVRAYDPAAGFRNKAEHDLELPYPWASSVQGGCFSPNGHLYLATDERDLDEPKYKLIRVFSAMSGGYLGAVRILAEEDNQELESVCYAPVSVKGTVAYVHAIVLENVASLSAASDNVFFKSYGVPNPAAV